MSRRGEGEGKKKAGARHGILRQTANPKILPPQPLLLNAISRSVHLKVDATNRRRLRPASTASPCARSSRRSSSPQPKSHAALPTEEPLAETRPRYPAENI